MVLSKAQGHLYLYLLHDIEMREDGKLCHISHTSVPVFWFDCALKYAVYSRCSQRVSRMVLLFKFTLHLLWRMQKS